MHEEHCEIESHGTAAAGLLRQHGPVTAVVRHGGAYHLVAVRAFSAGETILTLRGEDTLRPTRSSVQVDVRAHVEVPGGLSAERVLDECPWSCLNHSCAPNTFFRGRELVAGRALARFEELTFDYNSTEWELAEPFPCRCGAEDCRGALVRGFRHLPLAERTRLLPFLAEHLRRRLFEEADTSAPSDE